MALEKGRNFFSDVEEIISNFVLTTRDSNDQRKWEANKLSLMENAFGKEDLIYSQLVTACSMLQKSASPAWSEEPKHKGNAREKYMYAITLTGVSL